jgi:putative membrane protein
MNTSHGLRVRELIIATSGLLLLLAVTGCGTKQNRGPTASAETAAAREPAQRGAEETSSKPATAHSPSKHVGSIHHAAATQEESAAIGKTAAVLSQIHRADLTEIALGKFAEDRASAPEVRAYADQLVQDHTNVDRTVAAMAQKKGTHLSDQIASPRDGRQSVQSNGQFDQKLKSASGSEFDKLFLEQAGSDHQRLIQKLQQDREDANDDELEALIDKIEPILEQHRELEKILMKNEQA